MFDQFNHVLRNFFFYLIFVKFILLMWAVFKTLVIKKNEKYDFLFGSSFYFWFKDKNTDIRCEFNNKNKFCTNTMNFETKGPVELFIRPFHAI